MFRWFNDFTGGFIRKTMRPIYAVGIYFLFKKKKLSRNTKFEKEEIFSLHLHHNYYIDFKIRIND